MAIPVESFFPSIARGKQFASSVTVVCMCIYLHSCLEKFRSARSSVTAKTKNSNSLASFAARTLRARREIDTRIRAIDTAMRSRRTLRIVRFLVDFGGDPAQQSMCETAREFTADQKSNTRLRASSPWKNGEIRAAEIAGHQ